MFRKRRFFIKSKRFRRRRELGANLVETGFLVALIAIGAIPAIMYLGTQATCGMTEGAVGGDQSAYFPETLVDAGCNPCATFGGSLGCAGGLCSCS